MNDIIPTALAFVLAGAVGIITGIILRRLDKNYEG